MNNRLEKYIIVLLVIILISLAACAKPQKEYEPGPLEVVVEQSQTIGKLLGCMVAPKLCQETLEQKEWENVDKELDTSK
mgnify:CR=1 FL=1